MTAPDDPRRYARARRAWAAAACTCATPWRPTGTPLLSLDEPGDHAPGCERTRAFWRAWETWRRAAA